MAQGLIYPGDVVKTHYIRRDTPNNNSVSSVARKILKNEGVGGFFKGFTISALGCMPFIGIRMASYDTLMSYSRG